MTWHDHISSRYQTKLRKMDESTLFTYAFAVAVVSVMLKYPYKLKYCSNYYNTHSLMDWK